MIFFISTTDNYKLYEVKTYGEVRNAAVWQIMPFSVNKRILGFSFLSNSDFNDSIIMFSFSILTKYLGSRNPLNICLNSSH